MFQTILIATVAVVAIAWWRQHADLLKARAENERLVRLGERARPGPNGDAGSENPATPTMPAESGPASAAGANPLGRTAPGPAPAPGRVMTPAGMAPAPGTTGLVLARTRVASDADGLCATIRFHATTEDPLGIVAVVVRLPRDGTSRILDLGPAGDAAFESAMKRVSDDGKFAVFQGTAARMDAVEFALTVSAATTADVRGTCGIGPFDLAIAADQATARPK